MLSKEEILHRLSSLSRSQLEKLLIRANSDNGHGVPTEDSHSDLHLENPHAGIIPAMLSKWLHSKIPVEIGIVIVGVLFFALTVSCYCFVHQNARSITNAFLACIEEIAPNSVSPRRRRHRRNRDVHDRKMKAVSQPLNGRRTSETPLTMIQYVDSSSSSDEGDSDGKTALFPPLEEIPLDLGSLISPGRRRSNARGGAAVGL
jgi:hypothetical protein